VILSDMAPNFSGVHEVDHDRQIDLCEKALLTGIELLNRGGKFVTKVLDGPRHKELFTKIQKHFDTVKRSKPDASRKDSSEFYIVGLGFNPKEKKGSKA